MTWPFENDTSAITKKLAKKKFAKREAPESDGGDCRCAGGVSDLLYGNCVYFPDTNAAQSGCRYL